MFCVEQGVSEREELDGRDGDGVHLVAVADGQVLGTCRLLFVGPTVQFSRLAVGATRAAAGSRRVCWSWPTPRRVRAAPGGSCCTPRRTRARCTRAPDTSPAAACS